MYTIVCDGGCNKKGCYGSYIIYDDNGSEVANSSRFELADCHTNNEAEYGALLEAVYAAMVSLDTDVELQIYTDSQLVCKQLSGSFKIKSNNLVSFNKEARLRLSNYFWKVRWVPRRIIVGFLGH